MYLSTCTNVLYYNVLKANCVRCIHICDRIPNAEKIRVSIYIIIYCYICIYVLVVKSQGILFHRSWYVPIVCVYYLYKLYYYVTYSANNVGTLNYKYIYYWYTA